MTAATLTPEERAWHDALADAVEMGIYGDDALRYAEHMRGSLQFQGRVLSYALKDLGAAIGRAVTVRLR